MEEKKPKIEMLSQPLLTEEGFINPACVNELEAAIKNMQPTYIRLAEDSEWSQKRWTLRADIVSYLAASAVRCSPYPCPENLEVVLKYTDACLAQSITWDITSSQGKEAMSELSLCEINKVLHDILDDFEPFLAWNKKKNGQDCSIQFVSAFDSYSPDDSFIDLDALVRNVCLGIRDERRANDEFDRKFEAERVAERITERNEY